jgi:hypothetical protein
MDKTFPSRKRKRRAFACASGSELTSLMGQHSGDSIVPGDCSDAER